jgi:hypothetical protein
VGGFGENVEVAAPSPEFALGLGPAGGVALASVYPGVGDEGQEEEVDGRRQRRWFRALLFGLVLVLLADGAGVLPW